MVFAVKLMLGLFASAELRQTIAKFSDWDASLQLTPFMDFGTVWNSENSEATLAKNSLWSLGLGLRLLVGDNFTGRIDWGIPLVELETSGDTLQEDGVYFSVEYSFL